jgi:hypothetical protein
MYRRTPTSRVALILLAVGLIVFYTDLLFQLLSEKTGTPAGGVPVSEPPATPSPTARKPRERKPE